MEQKKRIEPMQTSRWQLLKLAFVFQCKLSIDAIRDLVLSPVSIGCTLIDLIKGAEQQNSYFQKLMEYGHKSDVWLNLFDCQQHDFHLNVTEKKDVNDDSTITEEANNFDASENFDQWFGKVESIIKQQHAQGGLTTTAKSTIDGYLNMLIDKKKP